MENEKRRKRASEVRISEEPAKRLRVSEDPPQNTDAVTQSPDELAADLPEAVQEAISALVQLKSYGQADTTARDIAGSLVESLLVRVIMI